jgi:hypothetical protein
MEGEWMSGSIRCVIHRFNRIFNIEKMVSLLEKYGKNDEKTG